MSPTEKLPDPPRFSGWMGKWERPKHCPDRDHLADLRRLTPGRYRHTCPSCGKTYEFTVDQPDLVL